MNPFNDAKRQFTRREFFGKAACGIGGVALASLLDPKLMGSSTNAPAISGLPHFAPKAKRVIYLLQNGAPTHVDLFDYKPMLTKMQGEPVPPSILGEKRFSDMTNTKEKLLLPNVTKFNQVGKNGMWMSNYMPHLGEIVDELCFIRSMHTTSVNHAPGIQYFLSGSEIPGRPTIGAWLSYGLGAETEDLPSFVAMTSRDKEASCGQIFYDFYWSSGFLPTKYQGVKFRGSGDPVLYLKNPDGVDRSLRREMLDDLVRLNEIKLSEYGDPEIATRISQYEMAYKMQISVPELTDFSNESKETLDMYGPDVHKQGTFAYNCLMARRLAERGTRYIQLMHAGWDQHNNLTSQLQIQCLDTDAPSAALVKDLNQRGLLDDTLVIWAGEFGRTPFLQGEFDNKPRWGRDHHPYGFTIWMAGGGVKPGFVYGATDEIGFSAVENPVHVHDFQATLMHLLGIDHEKYTYKFQGRNYRLTDVHGHVVKDVLV
ncbi:MAG: sulfatase [Opitutaceae bacterium]|nr:sulfatase [Opitutaceae bacterium]|tara:strand:+ start:4639 stop:6090 length:1452 start_codon:yes stop_codon:yes gene_type:complete